jgi:hemolysin III
LRQEVASASLDHSAIYLWIAGTTILGADEERIGVWLGAAIGMTLKLARPGRFDRLAIVLFGAV